MFQKLGQNDLIDDEQVLNLIDVAITGLNEYAQKAEYVCPTLIARFFVLVLGQEALFNSVHGMNVMLACNTFNELKEHVNEAAYIWFQGTNLDMISTAVQVI